MSKRILVPRASPDSRASFLGETSAYPSSASLQCEGLRWRTGYFLNLMPWRS
jgi:hypothetical protein